MHNVSLVEVQDEWIVDIDYTSLAKSVLIFLVRQPNPLTGNEIRFIRYYFDLTLRDFAQRFGVKHPTVLKWEQKNDLSAGITWGIEKDIRLFILDKLCPSNKDFREGYRAIKARFEKEPISQKIHPLCFEFSAGTLLMAS